MRRLLDAVYAVALLVLAPWLLWRAWRTGRYRTGLSVRLRGTVESLPTAAVWFHGVSVGEVHVLRQLVPAFRQRHPGRAVVVTSSTDTGLAEARRIFSDVPVFAFPFDFSWAVERTLRSVQPELVVLCESELWPNFLWTARKLGVPVAVVNARMSPRSLARYQLVAPLVRGLFAGLELLAAQDEEHAAALLALGGRPGKVRVTGNIKYDGARLDRHQPQTLELGRLLGVEPGQTVWIAGSTQAPEEDIVLEIFCRAVQRHPGLRLFLVPRQRDRFDEVARLLHKKGVPYDRRSQLRDEPARQAVVLVDTIGELSFLWGLADLAYVGGSLDGRRGGQNMIEPAAYGAAVTFGPHVWNFRQTAQRLVEVGGAYQVNNARELEEVTLRLLGDEAERRAAAQQARAFVARQQGATARTLDLLDGLLTRPSEKQVA
jgi:3-deoxy-D-manno-octulosonic-acid transferase